MKEYKTPKELFHIIKVLTSLGITKIDQQQIKGNFNVRVVDKVLLTPNIQPPK